MINPSIYKVRTKKGRIREIKKVKERRYKNMIEFGGTTLSNIHALHAECKITNTS